MGDDNEDSIEGAIPAPEEDPPTGKQRIRSPEPFGAPFASLDATTPPEVAAASLAELSPEFEREIDRIEAQMNAKDSGEADSEAARTDDEDDADEDERDGVDAAPSATGTTLALSTLLSGILLRSKRHPR